MTARTIVAGLITGTPGASPDAVPPSPSINMLRTIGGRHTGRKNRVRTTVARRRALAQTQVWAIQRRARAVGDRIDREVAMPRNKALNRPA